MSPFRFSFALFVSSAALLCAETSAPDVEKDTVHLERYVVSAAVGDRTSFDLAQGASLLAGAELHRRAGTTLGDTLDGTTGVNATAYAPGASRPLIRGLGGDRVRVLQSGIGSLDASNVSPDHATAIEPLFARRIEVLRGPAALLFGGSAVGGVVNVIDNRIPETRPERAVTGALEARGFGAASEATGVAALTGAQGDLAIQVDAVRRRAGDTRIAGIARIDPDAPAGQASSRLPNSGVETDSGSVGLTWFGDVARVGAAVSSFRTTYGVPVDEPISIALRQHRVDVAGEVTRADGVWRGVRARFGVGDYTHRELLEGQVVNTTFTNRAWEGRVELPHVAGERSFGTIGVQAERSDFAAVGEEVVTPPAVTVRQALFAVEQHGIGRVDLEYGARWERQSVQLGAVAADRPAVPGYAARSGQTARDTAFSTALGVVYSPVPPWTTALSVAYTERGPTAQERFSNGPHGGTGAWEVGTSALGKERSLGADFSLRKREGLVTGSIGVFANRFRGYIYERRLADDAIAPEHNPEALTPYQFTGTDALFWGAEAAIEVHVVERDALGVHIELGADYVRAEETAQHRPLPRIPPLRTTLGVRFDSRRWRGGVEARYVWAQERIASEEARTAGYALCNADVAYVLSRSTREWELFARATNLANRDGRIHASFLKEFAPMPGRGVVIGARLFF